MKVCKKCKKQVTNKSKICKYCGSDVSKARIIKNNNINTKKNTKINTNNINKKVEPKTNTNNINKKSEITKKINTNNKNQEILKKDKNIKIISKQEDIKQVQNNTLKTIINKIKQILLKTKDKIKKYILNIKAIINLKPKTSTKILVVSLLTIITLGTFSYLGVDAYIDRENPKDEIVIGEKATTDKIFSMGDLITYEGVDYKVTKVKTSKGNYYKTPKEGYQFVVVTVYIKNNTGDKIPYSYDNWTMSNSLKEEKSVMFTSINTEDALYSGELVIGGIKIGSMVFEQPINDSKLRLNYYDLKKDENGEDVIDYSKKAFSVSIKFEEEKDNTTKTNDSVVKTSDNQ